MLNGMCQFLNGLGNVDDGVESVLTMSAFDGLISIITQVYGNNAAFVVENMFTQREDGSMVMSIEEPEEAFRACLNGVA